MLETKRLILRPFRDSDADAAFSWFSDPEVFRFYTYGPYTLEGTRKRVMEYREQHERLGFAKCIVIEKATGTAIGDAGLMFAEDTGEVHVGYKLASSVWGKGFATEAAHAWVQHGFDTLHLDRIAALIHPQNMASIRVVQKLGFTLFETRTEDAVDWNVYEKLRIDHAQPPTAAPVV